MAIKNAVLAKVTPGGQSNPSHSNNEIDKRINVSKIANNISTMGDNSTAAGCYSRLITVLVLST